MPKKKNTQQYTDEDIALQGITYASYKQVIKEFEAKCKECRKPLEEYVDAKGNTLANGSKLAVVYSAGTDVFLKKTLRTGYQLTDNAVDVLRENGLSECIELVPIVRDDVVERLHAEGRISDDLLKLIYNVKTTYAFSVETKDRFKDE